jgi:elongation factor P hydroxylase
VVEVHDYRDLINLFESCFKDSYQTILVKGESEPIYIPKSEANHYHQLVFAHGFFASALHETAHWCVAGDERRRLEDFGYWYKPDGRTVEEQRIFEEVEVKPQALEWMFSVASGLRFRVSADNLAGGVAASNIFKQRVYEQVLGYLDKGLPSRANQFLQALLNFYQPSKQLTPDLFLVDTI